MQSFPALTFLALILTSHVLCQESSNQNQSDTLINKEILLPLQTLENKTFCKQWQPAGKSQWDWVYDVVYTAFTGQFKPLPNASSYQGQGILNASAYYRDPVGDVTKVNLLRYFDGSRASSNRNDKPTAVKFVSGNGTTWKDGRLQITWTPVFEVVITHIAEYIGVILGCDELSFPLYEGSWSMFKAHKFMDLEGPEMHYFIHNLYDSLVNTGVSVDDGIVFGTAIDNLFNKLCAPPRQIATYQPSGAQNICLDNSTCATWELGNATCSIYALPGVGQAPQNVSSTDPRWVLYGGDGPNGCDGYSGPEQKASEPSRSSHGGDNSGARATRASLSKTS